MNEALHAREFGAGLRKMWHEWLDNTRQAAGPKERKEATHDLRWVELQPPSCCALGMNKPPQPPCRW